MPTPSNHLNGINHVSPELSVVDSVVDFLNCLITLVSICVNMSYFV